MFPEELEEMQNIVFFFFFWTNKLFLQDNKYKESKTVWNCVAVEACCLF